MKWIKKLTVVQTASLVCAAIGLAWFVVVHEPLVYGERAEGTVVSSSYICTGGRGRRCATRVGVSYVDQNGVLQSSSFSRLGHDEEPLGTRIPIKYLLGQPKEIQSLRLYERIFDASTLWLVFAVLVYVVGRPFEKLYLKERNPFPKT